LDAMGRGVVVDPLTRQHGASKWRSRWDRHGVRDGVIRTTPLFHVSIINQPPHLTKLPWPISPRLTPSKRKCGDGRRKVEHPCSLAGPPSTCSSPARPLSPAHAVATKILVDISGPALHPSKNHHSPCRSTRSSSRALTTRDTRSSPDEEERERPTTMRESVSWPRLRTRRVPVDVLERRG